jgi:hypothetical protein
VWAVKQKNAKNGLFFLYAQTVMVSTMNNLREMAFASADTDHRLIKLKAKLTRLRGLVKRCDTNRKGALRGKSKLWSGYAEVEQEWEAKRRELRLRVESVRTLYLRLRAEIYAEELVKKRAEWQKQVIEDRFYLAMPDQNSWRAVKDYRDRHKRWGDTVWARITLPHPDWKALSPFAAEIGTTRAAVRLHEYGKFFPPRGKVKMQPWRVRKDRQRAKKQGAKTAGGGS